MWDVYSTRICRLCQIGVGVHFDCQEDNSACDQYELFEHKNVLHIMTMKKTKVGLSVEHPDSLIALNYLGTLLIMLFLYVFKNFCIMFGKTCVPC